jgi:hypothetical protein
MYRSIGRLGVVALSLLVSACAMPASNQVPAGGVAAAANPNVPGATGTTVVPGNNSTVASDATATYNQQKWPTEIAP